MGRSIAWRVGFVPFLAVIQSSVLLWAKTPDDTQTSSALNITGSVTVATDYHWRGISMSNLQPAIQGGIQLNHISGIYAGIWASSIDLPNNDASIEADYMFGYLYKLSPKHSLRLQYVDVNYPGASHRLHYNFEEYSIGLNSQSLLREKDQWQSAIAFSPNVYGHNGKYWRFDSKYSFPLNDKFAIFTAIGATQVASKAAFNQLWGSPNKDHYYDWKIGINANLFGLNSELYYTDNSTINPDIAAFDPRVVFTISKLF